MIELVPKPKGGCVGLRWNTESDKNAILNWMTSEGFEPEMRPASVGEFNEDGEEIRPAMSEHIWFVSADSTPKRLFLGDWILFQDNDFSPASDEGVQGFYDQV